MDKIGRSLVVASDYMVAPAEVIGVFACGVAGWRGWMRRATVLYRQVSFVPLLIASTSVQHIAKV